MSSFDLLSAATAAAERAAAYLRSARRPDGPAAWTVKDQRDFVTEVDRTSETLITEVLRERTVPFDDRQVARDALARLAGAGGKR